MKSMKLTSYSKYDQIDRVHHHQSTTLSQKIPLLNLTSIFSCNQNLILNPPTLPMSRSRNEQLIEWMAKAAMFGDCAVLGVASVLFTSRLITFYFADSYALTRIKSAPEVRVSDLKTLISEGERGIDDMLVVVKGIVEATSNLDSGVKISVPDVLVSQQTGDVGVVLQRTQMCKYYEAKGFSRWAWGIRYFFSSTLSEAQITTQRKVPFALVSTESWPQSKAAYILVNLDGSNQQLPVDTVFHQIHALRATPFAFIQALFGHEYPVAVIEEEKMLLIGKEIYAAGICSSKDGVLEIRSLEDFSYFLSDMSKGEMISNLTRKNSQLFWATILVGTVSVGILGYSVYRNWNRWKRWRSLRTRPTNNTTNNTRSETTTDQRTQRIMDRYFTSDDTFTYADSSQEEGEEEERDNHDIPVGESCIICLVRNREYAFVPCGHQVCCHRCANNVQNELSPQCPVCRRDTIGFLRIYRS